MSHERLGLRQRIINELAAGPASQKTLAVALGRSVERVSEVLHDLNAAGAVVKDRALSANRRPINVWRLPGSAPRHASARKLRPCLCCTHPFMSEGPHNRLCNTCRNLNVSPYALAL